MNPKHLVTPPSADLEKIRLQAEIAALNTTNTRLWVENTNLRTELAEVKQKLRAKLAAIPDIRVQEAGLVGENMILKAAVANVKKDAERYRWLRDSGAAAHWYELNWCKWDKDKAAEFDTAIDAAIAAQGEQG